MSRDLRCVLVAALLPSGLGCAPKPTHVAVVEPVRAVPVVRVPGPGEVAVVGDRPILLTELRARAKPFLIALAERTPPGPQRAAGEAWILKELLQKLIDEELEAQAAEKAHISVASDEVDAALTRIAGTQGLTVPELVQGAARAGLGELEYRDALRHQLLEHKMLELRSGGRPSVTAEELKEARRAWLEELESSTHVAVRL